MVVAELVEWLLGSTAGQIGLAVGLLAIPLYLRKLTTAGRLMQSWGGRVAFAAAAVGGLLLLGVVTGIDTARATELASAGGEVALEGAREVWEVLEGWR